MGKMQGLSSQVHMKLGIYTFLGHKNILITGYGSVIQHITRNMHLNQDNEMLNVTKYIFYTGFRIVLCFKWHLFHYIIMKKIEINTSVYIKNVSYICIYIYNICINTTNLLIIWCICTCQFTYTCMYIPVYNILMYQCCMIYEICMLIYLFVNMY